MWLWIIATLTAYFVKGLCGFANTLVFTSILGFGADNVYISPVDVMLAYPSNIIMTWKNRKDLEPKVWIPLTVLVMAGSIPGAFLLKNVNAQVVKIAFGAVVVLLGVEMYFREKSTRKMKENKFVLLLIGIVSGVLCGLFGIGALLAAYVGRVTESGDGFKANLNAVFVVENTFRILVYISIGVFTLSSLKIALILFPVMLAGLYGGMKCSQHMDEKLVKKLIIVLLVLSGIMLVIKNI